VNDTSETETVRHDQPALRPGRPPLIDAASPNCFPSTEPEAVTASAAPSPGPAGELIRERPQPHGAEGGVQKLLGSRLRDPSCERQLIQWPGLGAGQGGVRFDLRPAHGLPPQ